ncbi:flagellar basal body L-ring protein FlgH [Rhizobiaceae bacterium]|nr:flagellar basal body L-ring protein FlgH [Rhizobiaceae bacterium]
MTTRSALVLLALLATAACARLDAAQTPQLSAMSVDTLESRPAARATHRAPHSTFGARADLFSDRVALREGDVLTVAIDIDDGARLSNASNRSRDVDRDISISGSGKLGEFVQRGTGAFDVGSGSGFDGKGATNRSERVNLRVAATVEEVLPGGNLLIGGTQEVRVNSELRVLTVSGIVRPVDLGSGNVISYERIAEARISYGGRGPVAEVQRPPWGQRLFDAVSPI